MKRSSLWTTGLILCLAAATAQAQQPTVEFRFAGARVDAARFGARIEIVPVLSLIGAEATFSLAAGTYNVVQGEHTIQFALDRTLILIDGALQDAGEAPVASPGGVATSLSFLERSLLSPLGYHLEEQPWGYRIAFGARFADPVAVRPIAADFSATTTLVLNLGRLVEAEVEVTEEHGITVHFPDATPQIDSTFPLRSRRAQALTTYGQSLHVETPATVGLTSWHALDDPPRVILELGTVRPTPTPAPVRVVENLGPPPIVIDPGHGGEDTGAVAEDGLVEKDLVLQIAARLRGILRSKGHIVRLTRNGDENRALTDRTALANRLEAEAFISLHANASNVSSVSGAETYYMSLDRSATDEAAAATANLENQAAAPAEERSPLDLILWDLAQSEVLNESAKLALRIQGRLNAQMALRDRGVKQAPFVVLTGATMPAVLVEVGFLSNPDETRLLRDPEHLQRIAEAIALGVEDYVRRR